MNDYKPNSHKSKIEQRENTEKGKVEKVIKGTAKTKKKNKFAETFISEDVNNVKSYVIADILVPAAKKIISDIIIDSVDMILYGRTGKHRGSSVGGTRVNYSASYNNNRSGYRSDSESRTRVGYSYDDVILDSYAEADAVLEQLSVLIETYGNASVADLYDLVGITGNYTDNKYGWTNIKNAEAIRVRDGYLLKLPKVIPLN